LRTIEIERGNGLGVVDAGRKLGITAQTDSRWKKEYGGLRVDQAKRVKGVEQENARMTRRHGVHGSWPWLMGMDDTGTRRLTARLHQEGWRVNHARVERIWRQEGLTVPQKHPQRVRRWFADGSCIRRRAEYPNHGWSYDFVMERTQDGRPLTMLTVVDAYTRECLAIAVRRRLMSRDVQAVLSAWFLDRGCPTHMRSDNGPECIARALRAGSGMLTIAPRFIEPGSPWENGYVESCNGKLRDAWLSGELFSTQQEAHVLVERWRHQYSTRRPHRALGYRPPTPETRRVTPIGLSA
jgi:transposase InsO family protein